MLAIAVLLTGCIQIHLLGGGRAPLVESVVYGDGGAKILMVEIEGTITEADQVEVFGGTQEGTVARVREQLDKARHEGDVRALLLRVDTPGGSATASEVVYGELQRFKRERGVPVTAHFLGMATSGGYYVAMAADEIVAERTTVTGSIGVIFLGVSVAGLMDRWGIDDQTVTGGEHKDAGSPLRRMTREEKRIFQSVADDLHERFRAVVSEGRPKLSRERVVELSDGRIYSAPQALENGLVDAMGTLEETVERLRERMGVGEVQVVTYHRPNEWRSNIYTRAPVAPANRPAGMGASPVLPPLGAGFHYLWWPGAELWWPGATGGR